MRTVVIESPWRAATEERAELHRRYLKACIDDCARLKESPYASHWMLGQTLDDMDERQREQGIVAGFMWARHADARIFFLDLGMSDGMHRALLHAAELRQVVEYRYLRGEWAT